jgi:indole-3-glycerol phosphate synthase
VSVFVKTDTILDKILARKSELISRAREAMRVDPGSEEWLHESVRAAPPPRGFAAALRRETIALIAEVKKASPSKGVLIADFDPVRLASGYADGGAAAVSVLTDEDFFQGSLAHMRAVRETVSLPVLRKDFVIDPYQVYEGRAAGADAMLLIVAALEDAHLAKLHALICELGMAALVEVHDEAEMERALSIGATLIGVNNRDLRTFKEDLQTTGRLARLVPQSVTLVAESAIRTPEDVRRMGEAGAHAVLVGEGLLKSSDIAAQARAFSSQPRAGGAR